MKKIGIIVEGDFVYKHVGVRNLIFSLYRDFEAIGFNVDFIFFKNTNGIIHWYRININEVYIHNNFSPVDICYKGSAKEVYQQWLKRNHHNEKKDIFSLFSTTSLGNSINNENYDVIIYSVPWLDFGSISSTTFQGDVYGIVYDMIPNDYVIYNTAKPFSFASKHLSGYKFYNENCSKILCISNATKNRYQKYFKSLSTDVVVIPPSVPNYLRFINSNSKNKVRTKSIVLAGPFDPRKGLKYLPKILNLLKNEYDTLYLYGKQRCSDLDMQIFFSSLQHPSVIWYEEVSSETLIDIYKKSKLLIFPSDDEGLGLPIIESQILGCSVITTSFESASEIILDDNKQYLTLTPELDFNTIKSILNSDSELFLEEKSRDFFNHSKYIKFYSNLIKSS